MTLDAELEAWREDWRAEVEPLPDVKRKIRQQKERMIFAAILTCTCLAISTIRAFRKPSPFMSGLATGLWFTAICVGGYACCLRRGTWKQCAQTALTYAELSYKTAVATARIIRLSFWVSLVAIALLSVAFAWDWKHLTVGYGMILAALVAEAAVFRRYERRNERQIAETKEQLDNLKERFEDASSERFSR